MNLFKRLADLWLNFSRGERNGILVLTVLLFLMTSVITIIPYLPPKKITQEQKQILLALADSLQHLADFSPVVSIEPFDPNTLTEDGWRRIGLSQDQSRKIVRYINAGGRFKEPEDLLRIFGIDSAWVRSIIPYVQIANKNNGNKMEAKNQKSRDEKLSSLKEFQYKISKKNHDYGEINTADSVALVRLYGIGPVMARRIIAYRDRLGGFVSMMQLQEVYGMRSEMLQVLNEHYQCDSLQITKIPVNRVRMNELSLHPYLSRWNALSIVKYREIKGKIKNLNELKENQVLPDSVFQRIYPYLSVE